MSEIAAPSAPAAAPSTSTPSAPASSSAPAKPAAPAITSSSPARMTLEQAREKYRPNSFEAAITAPEETEDPAGLPDMSEPEETLETQPEVEEPVESDDPFAAFRDADIHGMKALDILKALQEGVLPEALWDKIALEMKDGDQTWRETVAQTRNGRQMQAKFTKNMQQLAEEKKTFAAEREAFNSERDELVNIFREWREDPAKFRAGMKKLGMPFEKAAESYAVEYGQIIEMQKLEDAGQVPQGTTERLKRSIELEAEAEEARLIKARHEARQQAELQKQQQAEHGQKTETVAKNIANTAVQVFDRLGLKRTPGAWNVFRNELAAVWEPGQAEPSPAEIEHAVRQAKAWYDEQVSTIKESKPAPTPKLGARPLDGGAPTKASPGAKAERLTLAQARAKYK